jgi:organic radical activating enzyme
MFLKTLSFNSTWLDYPDNESLAVLVQVLGCDHLCVDCINPQLQDYSGDSLPRKIAYCVWNTPGFFYSALLNRCHFLKTTKIVIGGGDPLFKENIQFIKSFLNWHEKEFDICIYTGYEIEEVMSLGLKGFKFIKCGGYDKSQKQISQKTNYYLQFASKNQKLYDGNYNLLSKDGRYYFTGDQI